ncbi:MAG: hypothetical protein R6X35_16590 [Candidatus Krumholzibacteriia bacterium]
MLPSRILVLLAAAFLLSGTATAATARFEGHVIFRGDSLAVRLALDESDTLAARLDIPQLWYAEEPVPARRTGPQGLTVEFPFGIGAVDLARDGQGWQGRREGFAVVLGPGVPPPYTKLPLHFGACAPLLPGTLYLPDGAGPHPSVVIVAGSGPSTRAGWSYRSKADYYARLGVAALVYDRRPYTAELPDGSPADLWSQADDIVAARDTLAGRPDLDPARIGLHGGSQGVWLALLAHGRHGGFAFMVLTGAPAVTPAEQQLQSLVQGMRVDGVADAEIAHAVAYQRLYFAVAHRGDGFAALAAARDAGAGTPWIDYVDQPRTLDDLAWWHRNLDFDPRAILLETRIPLLVMTGADDWVVPAVQNLPLFARYAQLAGNDRVTTLVIPRADHRLEQPPHTDADGRWRFFAIAPEARAAITAFLRGGGWSPASGSAGSTR